MSNHIYIVKTTFVDHDGDKSYGYRIYDDYAKDYNNMLEEDEFEKMSNEEMLWHAYENTTEVTNALFDYAISNDDVIIVNGVPFQAVDLLEEGP